VTGAGIITQADMRTVPSPLRAYTRLFERTSHDMRPHQGKHRHLGHHAQLKTQQAPASRGRSRSPGQKKGRSASPHEPRSLVAPLPARSHEFLHAQKETIRKRSKRERKSTAPNVSPLSPLVGARVSKPDTRNLEPADMVASTQEISEHFAQVSSPFS